MKGNYRLIDTTKVKMTELHQKGIKKVVRDNLAYTSTCN